MLLILKLTLVPFIILFISMAGRVFGPALSGWLGGLPVIAGPILYFLNVDQGPEFATNAALGALAAVSSLAGFCFVYAWTSLKHGVAYSLGAGVLAFLLSTSLYLVWRPNAHWALCCSLTSLFLATRWLPKVNCGKLVYSVPNKEIMLRMLAAAVLVLLVTGSSTYLGPRLSGLLAPFPVAGTVLAGFTHRYYGHDAAVTLLRGFLRGLIGMAGFDYILVILSPIHGFEISFVVAMGVALLVGVGMTKWRARTDA